VGGSAPALCSRATIGDVRPSLVPAALAQLGGVATWSDLSGATSSGAVARAVASGAVVQALPRVLVLPELLADADARDLAALLHAGPPAQLSHLSALRRWGLPLPPAGPDDPVHVVVAAARRRRAGGQHAVPVQVHRTRTGSPGRWRGGVPLVSLERAVVESWPLLTGSDQRAPAIVAVRRRATTAARVREELARHPRLRGRAGLEDLLTKIDAGCRSELELWGYERVFIGQEFADLERQVTVVVDGRTFVLDCFDRRAMLAIELDGRQYHDGPWERERDLARDAAVAELGILTVRYAHRRLTQEPAVCREQVLRLLQVRRHQLGA
jgi:very-short-patch-repair endonuclease